MSRYYRWILLVGEPKRKVSYDGEKSSETYTMEAKFGYILQGKNHIPSS